MAMLCGIRAHNIVVAETCHEAFRTYSRQVFGCMQDWDFATCSWGQAPLWQKESVVRCVSYMIENRGHVAGAWRAGECAGVMPSEYAGRFLSTHQVCVRLYFAHKDRMFHAIVNEMYEPS